MELTLKTFDEKNKVTVLSVKGRLETNDVFKFKEEMESYIDRGQQRIVLSMAELQFMNSMGLGVVVSLLKRIRKSGGDLKLVELTPNIKTLFEITRLDSIIDIFDEERQGLEKFRS